MTKREGRRRTGGGKNGWKKKEQQKGGGGVKEEDDDDNLCILEKFDKQNITELTTVANKGNISKI